MFSSKPSGVAVIETGDKRRLVFFARSTETEGPPLTNGSILLRVHIEQETATYFYSMNEGRSFQQLGQPLRVYFSWWKAARPAIFSFNTDSSAKTLGAIDVDWVHYTPILQAGTAGQSAKRVPLQLEKR